MRPCAHHRAEGPQFLDSVPGIERQALHQLLDLSPPGRKNVLTGESEPSQLEERSLCLRPNDRSVLDGCGCFVDEELGAQAVFNGRGIEARDQVGAQRVAAFARDAGGRRMRKERQLTLVHSCE